MRVPWTARRSNKSILKEINPENSLEELMLKLKLQYFGLLSTMNIAISTIGHREISTFIDMTPIGNENLGILDFRVSNLWQTLSNAFSKHR